LTVTGVQTCALPISHGNGSSIRINDDRTVTFIIDLDRAYKNLKGKCANGIRLKIFIESVPEPYRRNEFDRWGMLEILDVTLIK
jgi:hypothetical protein